MDDLDELKGRVARATRALSERDAEEQGRHAKLTALVAALEAKSLEARRDKEQAEQRLVEIESENEELRGLLVSLLDAVETGSRSRFADAIYALEARVSSLSAKAGAAAPSAVPAAAAATEQAVVEPELQAEPAPDTELEPEPEQMVEQVGEDDLDVFTATLAASCAVEQELAAEAEERRTEVADDARALLERIRRQVDLTDAAKASQHEAGESAHPESPEAEILAEAPPQAAAETEELPDETDDDGPLAQQPQEAADTLIEESETGEADTDQSGPDQSDTDQSDWERKRQAAF